MNSPAPGRDTGVTKMPQGPALSATTNLGIEGQAPVSIRLDCGADGGNTREESLNRCLPLNPGRYPNRAPTIGFRGAIWARRPAATIAGCPQNGTQGSCSLCSMDFAVMFRRGGKGDFGGTAEHQIAGVCSTPIYEVPANTHLGDVRNVIRQFRPNCRAFSREPIFMQGLAISSSGREFLHKETEKDRRGKDPSSFTPSSGRTDPTSFEKSRMTPGIAMDAPWPIQRRLEPGNSVSRSALQGPTRSCQRPHGRPGGLDH